jgi:hypothetical protein
MEIVSLCPLRAGSVLWQPRPGVWTLTVVAKATFVIEPQECPLADAQDEPATADQPWNDDPGRSLQAASDLSPFKPRCDVTLVGHASSPHGRPTGSLTARMVVGAVDKAIEVFPDRAWTHEGQLREGPRFLRMPLVYERAGGGPGTSNPVGVPAGGVPDRHGRVAVPNLQAPGVRLTAPGQYVEPVGFGPIAAWWPSRVEKLHRHAASFSHRGWAQQPLPPDLDFGYFNAAPADQQLDVLRDNERIVLEDLHAEHPRLVTSLPGVRARVMVERRPGAGDEAAMRCDTLSIDLDRGLCWLVWRAQIAIEHPAQPCRVLISAEGLPARVAAVPAGRRRDTVTADMGAALREVAGLPFLGGPPPGSPDLRPPSSPAFEPRALEPIPPAYEPPVVPLPPPFVRERPPSIPQPLPAPPAFSIGQMAAGDGVPRSPIESAPSLEGQAVLAASNLAAGPASPHVEEASRVAASPARSPSAARPDILDLLWFDPAVLDPVRREPRWQELIAEIRIRPPEVAYDEDPEPIPDEVQDRNDVFGLLAGAPSSGPDELDALVAAATSHDGRFEPPLAVVAGELAPVFEELEVLKATLAAASPFVGADKRLKDASDAAVEAIASPYVQASGAACEALTARVREAFTPSGRSLPAGYLDAQAERLIVEQRRYQRRTVLGEPRIRARLAQAEAAAPVPVYLPEALAAKLPLFARFPARLLVEVHVAQDQSEPHPLALRALALARVVKAPRRGA